MRYLLTPTFDQPSQNSGKATSQQRKGKFPPVHFQMYTYYLITRTCQIHEIQHLQYASQFCLKLLEAVTQLAQIACLQQLAGTVQHLLGGCILFSEQVQFGQPEVNLDMQVRCCYEHSLCTCLFKQEDSSLQIAPSLS